MLNIHMLRDAQGLPDARGDRVLYPNRWTGLADEEFAVYAVAMGHALTVGDWSIEKALSVDFCKAVVQLFRDAGQEPSQTDLTVEVAAQLALIEQANQQELDSATPVAGAEPPAPEPVAEATPRASRKKATA